MADGKELYLRVTSPYGSVLEKEIVSILFTTPEGEISIRSKHVNGVYQLKAGPFFVKTEDEQDEYESLGGIVLVEDNQVKMVSSLVATAKMFEKERANHLELLGQRYSEDLKSEADLQRVQMALRNSLIQKK